jgi:hypothetical protein
MLYIISGGDSNTRARAIDEIIKIENKGQGSIQVITRASADTTVLELDTVRESQSLFDAQIALVISNANEEEEIWEYLIKMSQSFVDSRNIFILTLPTLLKKDLKLFADRVIHKELKSEEKISKQKFNVFALTDSFGARDKLGSWLIYREAIERAHVEPREIHGVLVWIAKSMLECKVLSLSELSQIEMKPFVAQKATRFAKNFSKDELTSMNGNLVSLYHRAQVGEVELTEGLESLLLKTLS